MWQILTESMEEKGEQRETMSGMNTNNTLGHIDWAILFRQVISFTRETWGRVGKRQNVGFWWWRIGVTWTDDRLGTGECGRQTTKTLRSWLVKSRDSTGSKGEKKNLIRCIEEEVPVEVHVQLSLKNWDVCMYVCMHWDVCTQRNESKTKNKNKNAV